MERFKWEEFKETKDLEPLRNLDGFAVHWDSACGLLLINADYLVGSSVSEAMWERWSYRVFSGAGLFKTWMWTDRCVGRLGNWAMTGPSPPKSSHSPSQD